MSNFKRIGWLLVLMASAAAAEQPSPYASHQHREIKALSPQRAQDYLDGKGMGYALAAELNHYPGPMHALELGDQLGLTSEQRTAMARLMQTHKAEAREVGAALVRLERELDTLFAEKRATPTLVDEKLGELAAMQARYRGSHLKTHIEATKLLTPDQVARYDTLRGYAGGAASLRHGHGDLNRH